MEKYDVVIIGAGPAGLSAAQILAESGKDVLVLEKNRIIGPTICAGGLTVRDMDFVPKNIVDAEFNYMLQHTAKGSYEVDLGSHPVYTVDREKLGSNSIVRRSLDIPVDKTVIGIQYISKTLRNDLEVFVDDFKNVLKYGWIFPHRGFTSIGMGGWTGKAALIRRSLDELCRMINDKYNLV